MEKKFRTEEWHNYNTSSNPYDSTDKRIKERMATILQGNVSRVSVDKKRISHAHENFAVQSSAPLTFTGCSEAKSFISRLTI